MGFLIVALTVLSGICFLSGAATSALATTVFQQVIGGISFLMSAVLLVGACTVGALNSVNNTLKKVLEQQGPSRPPAAVLPPPLPELPKSSSGLKWFIAIVVVLGLTALVLLSIFPPRF